MYLLKLFVAVVVGMLFLVGCSENTSPVSPSEIQVSDPGSAVIQVQIGEIKKVGSFQKVRNIVLNKLYITLTAPGETTIYDTVLLSGNSSSTVLKTYSNMASLLKTWTVSAVSKDTAGMIIHSGAATFIVPARAVATVPLTLKAKYTMLKAVLHPIRDSVTRCELLINGIKMDDTSFAKQALVGDTVRLSYNYLDTGVAQHIRLNAYGTMWGFDTLLYMADTTIIPVSGSNEGFGIVLKWVGPTFPPSGQATMNVTLGGTGTVTIDVYIDPPYRFYKFVINTVGYGTNNPCLLTTRFLKGDTICPTSTSDFTVLSYSSVSAGTIENLLMGISYCKPTGGAIPWQWIVDMHQAQIFTKLSITTNTSGGFYGVPTSVSIYGTNDQTLATWTQIGAQTMTAVYQSISIPLTY